MQTSPQSLIDLQGIKKLRSGKVREVFDLGETLLFVVTDRISAFDVILPDPIPYKGAVLNQISAFWFKRFDNIPNHFVTARFDEFPVQLQPFREQLAGRSMIVKKTQPLPVECVVRGYLAGSGWKEYQESQSVCGIKLPPGLKQASKLPEPIFTPATKAETGHDENIDMTRCTEILGKDLAERVKTLSLDIYSRGRAHADQCGIIVADTKFEFGTIGDDLLLIDECLTPDSSRFWPKDDYTVGQSPPSFDKQFVRDYLETLDWDKTPPAPRLPKEVMEKSSAKYVEAFRRLTGGELVDV
ncbi:MAG TPA: phosphoribosylaminoimidazolesuccinocarboxamide synthase [Candidatus Udaeobacter sp.]|jgi:phosphoribosylaminoimidazole-succinocarboxamide synthase